MKSKSGEMLQWEDPCCRNMKTWVERPRTCVKPAVVARVYNSSVPMVTRETDKRLPRCSQTRATGMHSGKQQKGLCLKQGGGEDQHLRLFFNLYTCRVHGPQLHAEPCACVVFVVLESELTGLLLAGVSGGSSVFLDISSFKHSQLSTHSVCTHSTFTYTSYTTYHTPAYTYTHTHSHTWAHEWIMIFINRWMYNENIVYMYIGDYRNLHTRTHTHRTLKYVNARI